MVGVLASNVVDRVFEPRSGQTKDYKITGEFVVNDEDKANLLNTFFCSISEIIDSDLPTPVFDNRTGRKLDVFNIK
jgi:hypothetical protein